LAWASMRSPCFRSRSSSRSSVRSSSITEPARSATFATQDAASSRSALASNSSICRFIRPSRS
jgi:hypothetical protein